MAAGSEVPGDKHPAVQHYGLLLLGWDCDCYRNGGGHTVSELTDPRGDSEPACSCGCCQGWCHCARYDREDCHLGNPDV